MRRVEFFALAALLILTPSLASADPITAVIAAVNAFAATSALAAFVVRIGISLALSALQVALQKKPGDVRRPGIKTEATTTGGTNPQSFILGKYATSGNMVAPPYSHPNSGAVPNKYLTYVVDVSDIPGAQFSRVIVAGEYMTDLVASAGDHDFEGLFSGGAAPHFYLTWHDGTQTAADPWMMANHAADPDRPWSADMVGTGVAYAVVTFVYNRLLFNGLPGVRFEVEGIPLYDPRLDGSVGGTGAHRWADPATWAFSENPLVMVYNILRGIALPDGKTWGGRAAASDLPLDNWFAAMNECDLPIALAGGGDEAQYRAGFEVGLDDQPAAIIEELLKSASAEITEIGGVYKVRVGPPALPVYFFSDLDVVITEAQSLRPYPGLDGVFNAIHASHPAPAAIWETRDAPSLYNPAFEAEDGGRQLVASVDLPGVTSDTQVQRLMAAWIKDERRFRRHNLTLPPDAAILEPLDSAAWTSPANGYTAKVFEVGELQDDLTTLLQGVALRERDADDFLWIPGSDEITVSHPSTATLAPVARTVPGWDVIPSYVADASGTYRRPAIAAIWTGTDMGDAAALEIQVRAQGQTDLVAQRSTTDLESGRLIISEGIVAGVIYEARARLVMRRARAWTSWLSALAPDLRLEPADISDATWTAIATDATDLAQGLIDGYDLTSVEPIRSEITRLDADIDLRDIDQRTVAEALGVINGRVLWMLTKISATDKTVRDAGIYTDPEGGTVRIAAVESQAGQISETEIRLDAAEANINLRATYAELNSAISSAVLDPSQIPIISDLEFQVSNVEIDLDALAGVVSLKADTTTVSGVETRLTTAEADINGLEGSITLKVDQTDFDAVETRVQTAEITLGTMDGPSITATVADTRYLYDAGSIKNAADLKALLRAYDDRKAIRQDIAYATTDMRALVSEDRVAMASIETALGAAIDGNVALIESETLVRASETAALAQDIATLEATTATQTAALTEINKVAADSESANALALHQVQLDVSVLNGGVSGSSSAIAGLTTRVDDAEGTITIIAQDVVDLAADLSDAQTGISGQATALSQLTTRVDDAEGAISSQSQSLTSLSSRIGTAEGDISGQATAIQQLDTDVSNQGGTITALSSAQTTLTTTVGTHTTTLSEYGVSIDGVMAEKTIKLDVNGHISGLILRSELTSGGVVSSAAFIADKFAIVGPGATPETPFIVYTSAQVIGGKAVAAGVYMDAAFIHDGFITNAMIGTAVIETASIKNGEITNAKIADATIRGAKIKDAEIDTLQLAGNAVTVPAFNYEATHSGTIGSLVTINTLAMTRTAGVTTKLDISLRVAGDSAVASLDIQITRQIGAGAETTIHTINAGLHPRGQHVSFVYEDADTAGGATTYRVQGVLSGSLDQGNTGPSVSNIAFYATQFKR